MVSSWRALFESDRVADRYTSLAQRLQAIGARSPQVGPVSAPRSAKRGAA